jgi:hypothetical protein
MVDFTVPRLPGAAEFSGFFEADGTVTTLTCSLQIVLDGVHFADYIVADDFLSNTGSRKLFPQLAPQTHSLLVQRIA